MTPASALGPLVSAVAVSNRCRITHEGLGTVPATGQALSKPELLLLPI
jgi:hypothetical protein